MPQSRGVRWLFPLYRVWVPQAGPRSWRCSGCMPTVRTWSVSGSFWKGRLWPGFTATQVRMWSQDPSPSLLEKLAIFPSTKPSGLIKGGQDRVPGAPLPSLLVQPLAGLPASSFLGRMWVQSPLLGDGERSKEGKGGMGGKCELGEGCEVAPTLLPISVPCWGQEWTWALTPSVSIISWLLSISGARGD